MAGQCAEEPTCREVPAPSRALSPDLSPRPSIRPKVCLILFILSYPWGGGTPRPRLSLSPRGASSAVRLGVQITVVLWLMASLQPRKDYIFLNE